MCTSLPCIEQILESPRNEKGLGDLSCEIDLAEEEGLGDGAQPLAGEAKRKQSEVGRMMSSFRITQSLDDTEQYFRW